MFDRLWALFVFSGMPVVAFYHQLNENIFLNCAAKDAAHLEWVANEILTPVHYILEGKEGTPLGVDSEIRYTFRPKFQYRDDLVGVKMCACAFIAPFSFVAGTSLKAISHIFEDVRFRHKKMLASRFQPRVISQNAYYYSVGIDFTGYDGLESFESKKVLREEGAENYLAELKEGMRDIYHILKKYNIPCWVDCGTCLGAYRHGGIIPYDEDVDLAILESDHDNVMRALRELNTDKFHVQNWSGRYLPKTYIRVYVREAREHIDIYHFKMDTKKKIVRNILSNENSRYMPVWWKIRERRFAVETPFSDVFPLKKAHFDGIEVYVPNKIEPYLQARYGKNLSPIRIYNPETKAYEMDVSHPYWQNAFVK